MCTVTGSTPRQTLVDNNLADAGDIVELNTYSSCVDELLKNQVDAVTTDDAILLGYAAQDPDHLRVVGQPFGEDQPYGIGMSHDDKAFRDAVNSILQEALESGVWQKIYDDTLGKSGNKPRTPTVQR